MIAPRTAAPRTSLPMRAKDATEWICVKFVWNLSAQQSEVNALDRC